ncbi:Seminal metalloprotease 1 [Gryllus bimaculatus]|nr:Seminal metalloprotease 1 [Gryllus bimaculatus]
MLDLAEENEYPDIGDKYQGDIIRPSDLQRGDSRNAVKIESHLWPGGVIPYVLHSNYTGDRKKMMMAAMRGLEKETCIKFVPWSGQQDYVLMRTVPGDGCYAMVEYWPDFSKANPSEVSTYGVAYGYDSIMHYPKNAFSKNGKPTIVAKKDPSKELGQRKKPTKGDILKVRKMYKC